MANRVQTLAQGSLNWEYVVEAATWHQIVPLLHHHLTSTCPTAIPDSVQDRLQSLYYAHAVRSVRLGREELPALLSALQEHNIAVLPFKGPILGAKVYGELSLRSFVDLDLLVEEEAVPQVHEILKARGYSQNSVYNFEQAYSSTIAGLPYEVDVHWQIADPIHSFRIDYDQLWRRAQRVSISGVNTDVFAEDDLFIVLGIHGSKHG